MFSRQFCTLPFICLVEPFLQLLKGNSLQKKGVHVLDNFIKALWVADLGSGGTNGALFSAWSPLLQVSSYDWSPTTVCMQHGRIYSNRTWGGNDSLQLPYSGNTRSPSWCTGRVPEQCYTVKLHAEETIVSWSKCMLRTLVLWVKRLELEAHDFSIKYRGYAYT
jgi:hypothetical protein